MSVATARRDRFVRLVRLGALAGLAVVVLGPSALAWWASGVLMRPPWYVFPGPSAPLPSGALRDPRSDFALDYEDVAFATDGGATLRGWLVPSADARSCAVVLAGGGWSDRRSLVALAPSLHAAGYAVLAFDYREHGQSDGAGRGASWGLRESRDVAAAARYLRERGAARVAAIGYSMGGTAAILAAADGAPLDAVIASTPGTTLGDLLATVPETRAIPAWLRGVVARLLLLRVGAPLADVARAEVGPLYAVERIAPRPLLLLHGGADAVNAIADARRLLARAKPPKKLLVVPGAGHLDVFDDAGGEAQRQIAAFLDAMVCPAR